MEAKVQLLKPLSIVLHSTVTFDDYQMLYVNPLSLLMVAYT